MDEDFFTETENSNVRRRKPNTPLKKQKLRSDAVPSIFPNMAKYLRVKKFTREENVFQNPQGRLQNAAKKIKNDTVKWKMPFLEVIA